MFNPLDNLKKYIFWLSIYEPCATISRKRTCFQNIKNVPTQITIAIAAELLARDHL